MGKTLIVITGPTAVGKTKIAVELAIRFNTEIISVDSRQLYKEMSIGTAKPAPEEMQGIKHHFIDSHSIQEDYSAGKFEAEATQILDKIFKKNDTVIAVGGSGLYLQALCSGIDELPGKDARLRNQLNGIFEREGIQPLQEKLRKLDPRHYGEMDINNHRRLIRAIEVCIGSGNPYHSLRKETCKARPFSIIKIGLSLERTLLNQKINKRVEDMFQNGLTDEVSYLLPDRHLPALNTVGYKELFDYFDGNISLETARELIQRNTRRFAKRQYTWFGKDNSIKWFPSCEQEAILRYINEKYKEIA